MTDQPANSAPPQGTLDLPIRKALELDPMHGWGVAQRIQQVSQDALPVGQELGEAAS